VEEVTGMKLPRTDPWKAGDQLSAEDFNEIEYAFNFLLNPPECVIYQTAVQSVANSSFATVSMGAAYTDTESDASSGETKMWNPAIDKNKITIQTAGWYEVEYHSAWAVVAGNDRRSRYVGLADGTRAGLNDDISQNGIINEGTSMIETFLARGSTLAMGVWQSTGGSINTSLTGPWYRRFYLRAKWVSL
jgi:hypothetical protein